MTFAPFHILFEYVDSIFYPWKFKIFTIFNCGFATFNANFQVWQSFWVRWGVLFRHFLKEFSKDFQRKYWDSKYMLLNFLVYFFILLILDSGNFDIMTNFTLKIFSLYEWLSFWINLSFGCNIEFLKLIKTHPTFHRYYPTKYTMRFKIMYFVFQHFQSKSLLNSLRIWVPEKDALFCSKSP